MFLPASSPSGYSGMLALTPETAMRTFLGRIILSDGAIGEKDIDSASKMSRRD